MASTNKTTNYELSQFVGSDKPAWLGDYNQDMSKIDAGMKDNADDIAGVQTTIAGHTTAIAGNTSDIASLQSDMSTAQGDITSLQSSVATNTSNIATNAGDIDTLETRCDTIEGGQSDMANAISSLQTDNTTNQTNIANNASNIATLQTNLNAFETKFNLTPQTITSISGYSSIWTDVNLTLAQDSTGSIYKLYGTAQSYVANTTTASLTAVKGLTGYYGVKTTLQVAKAPDQAYVVDCSGIERIQKTISSTACSLVRLSAFAVDEDGYIYIAVSTNNSIQVAGYQTDAFSYFPCIYFNETFGDTPTPNN